MKIIFFQQKKKSGVSLVEVIISTTIFVIILLSMTGIFKMVLDAQRQAIATQNVQESLKFFFEVISKEIRMAKRAGGGCAHLPANARFATSSNAFGEILYLKNYHDECVTYQLDDDNGVTRFYIERDSEGAWLSPRRVNVNDLQFFVHEVAGEQAYISISLDANYIGREAEHSRMRVQTTITSRYYRPN
jgi:type II secretory pathway pseudopilin PulG